VHSSLPARRCVTRTCVRAINSCYGTRLFLHLLVSVCVTLLLCSAPALAQETAVTDATPGAVAHPERTGTVRVDGQTIVQLRGISAYPAEVRASAVAERIRQIAADPTISPDSITATADGESFSITAGDKVILRLYPADAELEDIPLPLLAEATSGTISGAIVKYRQDRTSGALSRSAAFTTLLTLLLLALIWGLGKLRRWLERVVRVRVAAGMESLERKSGAAVHRGHLWGFAQGFLQLLWVGTLLVLGYFYLSSVLGTFPWTRGAAHLLLEYIRLPLVSMGNAFVRSIPNLVFLIVLYFVVRFILRALHTFFQAIDRGRVTLNNFEQEWAIPTFRLLRIAILAFALVVAYPYIPGSDSAAFKGVSLFLGVIVSIGSTSFISNLIAGIALTYRGVFREGDWVRIGDTDDAPEGRVEEIRSQLVRLRTRSNERISVPSSTIINSNVTNYSQQLGPEGLVLRCEVGIGYDVSWQTVERLLLQAAADTEGVLQAPAPRVQTRKLGNFAVEYSLLAHIADAAELPTVRSALNRAVLDRFHEAEVQIMSPAYEGDPKAPKIPRAEG